MLIQIEKSTRESIAGGNSNYFPAPRYAPGARHNLWSAARSALLDVCAVLAAFLLVTATGLGLAFAGFVLIFCSF